MPSGRCTVSSSNRNPPRSPKPTRGQRGRRGRSEQSLENPRESESYPACLEALLPDLKSVASGRKGVCLPSAAQAPFRIPAGALPTLPFRRNRLTRLLDGAGYGGGRIPFASRKGREPGRPRTLKPRSADRGKGVRFLARQRRKAGGFRRAEARFPVSQVGGISVRDPGYRGRWPPNRP